MSKVKIVVPQGISDRKEARMIGASKELVTYISM